MTTFRIFPAPSVAAPHIDPAPFIFNGTRAQARRVLAKASGLKLRELDRYIGTRAQESFYTPGYLVASFRCLSHDIAVAKRTARLHAAPGGNRFLATQHLETARRLEAIASGTQS